MRLWGSVAFIVANVGAGALLGVIDPVHLIWLIVAALVITTLAAINLNSLDASLTPADQPQASPRQLWSNPAFLAVAAAASLTQGSHALYYGFSTMEWRAAGIGGITIGVLWAIGVLAEIVLFAFVGAAGDRADDAADDRRGGRDPALGRDGVRSADRGPAAAATAARRVIRGGASRRDGISGARGAAGAGGDGAGLVATVSGIVMASATGLSGLIYAASGSFAYLAMAAMGLAGLVCALMAHRLARRN